METQSKVQPPEVIETPPPYGPANCVINTRAMSVPTTGVQRYVRELLPRLRGVAEIRPALVAHGIPGHAWEQLVLPWALRGRLLWSPSNTGPLAVEHQVVTVHDVVAEDHPEWFRPKLARWYRHLIPRLVRRVRHVIAVSEFTKERLMATTGVEESRVTVVHHGVDERFQPQAPEVVAGMRERLALPPGPYLLSLSSLEPRKNLQRLLRCWRAIQARTRADLHLVVAGAPGNPAIFAELNLGPAPARTVFLGHVPDDLLPALYTGALAFAYISLYEGFGFPPLEAMACGTPVLASNTSAFPSILGKAAMLVDPCDETAIAAGLEQLAQDAAARARLRAAGWARAREFSWSRAAALTQDILDRFA